MKELCQVFCSVSSAAQGNSDDNNKPVWVPALSESRMCGFAFSDGFPIWIARVHERFFNMSLFRK